MEGRSVVPVARARRSGQLAAREDRRLNRVRLPRFALAAAALLLAALLWAATEYRRAARWQVEPDRQSLVDRTLSLYYADPDGNRMELQVDACSAEEGRAMLRATDNPVGVMFDPEALVARLKGGESEEALLVQPAGEPSPIPAAHGIT